MALPVKAILWVDDEAERLESHRLFLREKGYEVEWALNADDAVEMLRRRPYDLVLLDEQMPGKRGLEAYREIRAFAPTLPVVMVTKSEEDATLREAIGADVREYLVKPVNPRQVLTVITRVLEGPQIRQQAIARRFAERFRTMQLDSRWPEDWRGWIDRFAELMRWDIDLAEAGETGLYDALKSLYSDMHREFAGFMEHSYPRWLRELEGDRPPLSVDVVQEFVLPVLRPRRRGAVRGDRLPAAGPVDGAGAAAGARTSRSRRRTTTPCCPRPRRTRATRCSAACFRARSPLACPTGGANATRTSR